MARGPHRRLLGDGRNALHRRSPPVGLPGPGRPFRAGVLRPRGGGRHLLRAGPDRQRHGHRRPAWRRGSSRSPSSPSTTSANADEDRRTGKRTLAVRFGPGFARGEYIAAVVAACLLPLVLYLTSGQHPYSVAAIAVVVVGRTGLPPSLRCRSSDAEPRPRLHCPPALALQRRVLYRLGFVRDHTAMVSVLTRVAASKTAQPASG